MHRNLYYSDLCRRKALALAVLLVYLAFSYWYETRPERNTASGFNRQQLTQHEPTIEIYNERGVLTNR